MLRAKEVAYCEACKACATQLELDQQNSIYLNLLLRSVIDNRNFPVHLPLDNENLAGVHTIHPDSLVFQIFSALLPTLVDVYTPQDADGNGTKCQQEDEWHVVVP